MWLQASGSSPTRDITGGSLSAASVAKKGFILLSKACEQTFICEICAVPLSGVEHFAP